MRIYVAAPGNQKRLDFCQKNDIGLLYAPSYCNGIKSDDFVLDNGAFRAFLRGEPFDMQAYVKFMEMVKKSGKMPYFAVVPDIVAGGAESLKFSLTHLDLIPENFPRYLAVQDGMYQESIRDVIPFFDGIFIGGSVVWKWRTAESWVRFAHDEGKKCHIGRVSTLRNILRAYHLDADSVDGSTLTRHNKLHKIVEWREELKIQKLLDKEDWLLSVGVDSR